VNPAHQRACLRCELSRRHAPRWLNPDLVGEIRGRLDAAAPVARLAADLGLNYWTVADAISGRTWAD
jgi:hypothetical protein